MLFLLVTPAPFSPILGPANTCGRSSDFGFWLRRRQNILAEMLNAKPPSAPRSERENDDWPQRHREHRGMRTQFWFFSVSSVTLWLNLFSTFPWRRGVHPHITVLATAEIKNRMSRPAQGLSLRRFSPGGSFGIFREIYTVPLRRPSSEWVANERSTRAASNQRRAPRASTYTCHVAPAETLARSARKTPPRAGRNRSINFYFSFRRAARYVPAT